MYKKKKKQELYPEDYDTGEFAFVAGYTSAGVPYGICRDEIEEETETAQKKEDLPFK